MICFSNEVHCLNWNIKMLGLKCQLSELSVPGESRLPPEVVFKSPSFVQHLDLYFEGTLYAIFLFPSNVF